MAYLIYLSIFSSLFPFILFVFKGKIKKERAIFLFVTVSAATELVSTLLVANGIRNIELWTVYSFIEGFFILLIISQKVDVKAAKLTAYCGISILAILTFITFDKNLPGKMLNTVEAVFIFTFSIYYFVYLVQKADVPVLTQYSFFWINTAFLFYFAINLFVGAAEHFFHKSIQGHYTFLYAYHLVANIIFNVLLTIGVWKMKAT